MYCPPPPSQRAKRSGLGEYGVAPLAVVAAGPGIVKKIAGRFKSPAHKRAAKEVKTLVPRALAGDAAALARLEEGAAGAATAKAKAVFRAALDKVRAQLAGQRPAGAPPITTPQVTPTITTITAAGPVVTTAAPPPSYTPPSYTPTAPAADIPGATPEAATDTGAPPAEKPKIGAGIVIPAILGLLALARK